MKRLLARRHFLKESREIESAKTAPKREWRLESGLQGKSKEQSMITEISPLRANLGRRTSRSIDESDIDDFFPILAAEIDKINSFFVGKIAELRVALDEIYLKRQSSYRNHHTGEQQSDLTLLRDIYIDLVHLRSYCDLNHTGDHFLNII